MSGEDTGLPTSIKRPLFGGAIAVVIFIIGVVVWSVAAPLATSVNMEGILVSSRPSYAIQHAFGGPISWVGVREQEPVSEGDPLFRFDVSTQQIALEEVMHQLAELQAEHDVIVAMRSDALNWHEDLPPSAHVARYTASIAAMHQRQAVLRSEAQTLELQAIAGDAEAALIAERIEILEGLRESQDQLLEKGLVRESDIESLTGQILDLTAQLSQRHAATEALFSQSTQAETQVLGEQAEFDTRILATLRDITLQMSRLRSERSRLEAEIAAAEIVSPVNGHIHALHFDSALMVAPRGQTLAVISQNLDRPKVRLTIPPSSIDQVQVGMQGKLVIPSLPQREMPQLLIEIVTISPEAEKDSDGVVRGYVATAQITDESLNAAFEIMDSRFRLVTDMPVSATLTGREITFAQYIVKPFLSVFQSALQD